MLENPKLQDILECKNLRWCSMRETAASVLGRDITKVFLYEKEKGLKMMRDRVEAFELNY